MAYYRDPTLNYPVKLLTYRDAIAYLINYCGGGPQDAEQEWIRGSIDEAYLRLFNEHPWRYYRRAARLTLSAPYSTGTITTSGATVTLSGGIWPAWATDGTLAIDGHTPKYRVATRTSNAVLVLQGDAYPASNVTSATSYTLYRNRYPLPSHLQSFEGLCDETCDLGGNYISPSEWLQLERLNNQSTSNGFYWTIAQSGNEYGTVSLLLHGYPDAAQTVDYLGRFAPRPLKYEGMLRYSSAVSGYTISTVLAGATSCTASGWTPPSDLVGTVLRFVDPGVTRSPTGTTGLNPYAFQKIITGVASSTLTLDSAADAATTTGHFAVSDPLDMPQTMHSAFFRCCEYLYAMRMNRERLPVAEAMYVKELRRAMGAETRGPAPALLPGRVPYRSYTIGPDE